MYKATVGDVIETAIQGLTPDEITELVKGLATYLVVKGAVGEKVVECLNGELGARR